MNLHYKVEMAFDNLQEALSGAANNSESHEELTLYSKLADDCIGLRDQAHRDLTNLVIKKAAPAAGTTEAAKSDSDKESISSVSENEENVKARAYFRVDIYPNDSIECSFDADTYEDAKMLYEHASVSLLDLFKMIREYDKLIGGAK